MRERTKKLHWKLNYIVSQNYAEYNNDEKHKYNNFKYLVRLSETDYAVKKKIIYSFILISYTLTCITIIPS